MHRFILSFNEGESFGELGIVMKKSRSGTVVAKTDV
jgi:CRP-like cAMP-binding protein